jgi:trigger factor
MQVTELESKKLKKSFKIVVDAARISKQTEVELKAAGEQVKIPGFRPGYIPMKILQQRYGKSVQSDVLKQIINQVSSEVVSKNKLRPAMTPQINIEEYKEGGELSFTMTVESFPDMPEVNFDKITIDRKTYEITEKDIDEAQGRIAEHSHKLVREKEGAKAKNGSVLTIAFKGMIDGVAFKGGSADSFNLELGSGQFIAGFEDQLIGAKEGDDVIVKVAFPKDYAGADVAGKDAVFEVKVKEIQSKEPGIVDDEFAKERGFNDLAGLRDAIRNQMVREYDQVVRNQLKKVLFDALEAQQDFDLPESMVDMEFKSIWERLKQAQAQGDESVAGKDEDALREEYQKIAERRVKLGLLLADIGTKNKIKISQEELTQAVIQQARQFPGQEKQVMEFYRNNPERVEDLRGPILEEKAVDYVLSKVKFNDQKVSLDDLGDEDEDEGEGSVAKKPKAKKAQKSADTQKKRDSAKKKAAK